MSNRNTDYQFISIDTSELVDKLIAVYEKLTGVTVQPASPERLFIAWVADVVLVERSYLNFVGNQNLPSRAEGSNLDALGELFYDQDRPTATAASCTVQFKASDGHATPVTIPKGTRITDPNHTLYWETTEDLYMAVGINSATGEVVCQTAGIAGNGYTAGQLTELVDVYSYYDSLANTTTSDGGADAATDDEFYELMRASMDAYSCAGSRGAYEYWAKQVSTEILDIKCLRPNPGYVYIYGIELLNGKTTDIYDTSTADAVLEACSEDTVRPLTDNVSVQEISLYHYGIKFTYYRKSSDSRTAAEVKQLVDAAVEKYIEWQDRKIGRDLNPSYLISLLMETGIKRVDIEQPTFRKISSGVDKTESVEFEAPECATNESGGKECTDGGVEDD